MSSRIQELMGAVSDTLRAMPATFSTVQWGGRAWKRPVGRAKGKLVAFVALTDDDRAVHVSFKLDPTRAADEVDRRDWIEPHSFRTLSPSGWVTATLRTKRQLVALKKLIAESYALHGPPPEPPAEPDRPSAGSMGAGGAGGAGRHIDQVMGAVRAEGWQPADDW